MNVLVAEHKNAQTIRAGRIPFNQMLAEADVVSLHCPLTQDTHHLIAESELRRMKPSSILINVARGGIVDEAALTQALQEGWIAAAGIDVLSREPPCGDNPLLKIAGTNCIITPHVAWASQQSMSRLAEEVICNIEAFYDGKSCNRVT